VTKEGEKRSIMISTMLLVSKKNGEQNWHMAEDRHEFIGRGRWVINGDPDELAELVGTDRAPQKRKAEAVERGS
jgi:hypothetical protein